MSVKYTDTLIMLKNTDRALNILTIIDKYLCVATLSYFLLDFTSAFDIMYGNKGTLPLTS